MRGILHTLPGPIEAGRTASRQTGRAKRGGRNPDRRAMAERTDAEERTDDVWRRACNPGGKTTTGKTGRAATGKTGRTTSRETGRTATGQTGGTTAGKTGGAAAGKAGRAASGEPRCSGRAAALRQGGRGPRQHRKCQDREGRHEWL